MNAQQLLEMALLDSCGVLEPDELDAFERAFADAPESVKAQIRREQSRFADQTQLLPNVEPRPELRRMVVDAVRTAAAKQRDETLSFEEFVRTTAVGTTPADIHQRRVFPMWRAAAIILGVTTIFGGVLSYELRNQIETMGEQLSTNTSADFFLRFGDMPGLKQAMLSANNAEEVRFTSVDGSSEALAAIFSDTDSGRSFLVCYKLPELEEGGQYEVVQLDDDQNIRGTLASFGSNGETDGHEFAFDEALRGSVGIAARLADGSLRLVMVAA